MRRLVVAFLCATVTSSAAIAADMPVKAPPVAPVLATNWTGIYVNGGIGYGIWSGDTTQSPTTGITQTQGGKGWHGVVGLGYDYQFLPSFLVGVFGDYNFGSIKGTLQDPGPFFAGDTKERSAWAVGGRVGWLVTPDALAYVNGGYTSARFSGASMIDTGTGASTGFSTPDTTFHGWFVGIGSETTMPFLGSFFGSFFGPGWFWRNEYRYASYENQTLTDSNGVALANSINFKPVVQTVTSQILYKFNSGGPTYQAPPPIAPTTWSGIYLNGGFGYGAWSADTTTESPATGACVLCVTQTQGGKGWLGVVGAGIDYQIFSKIVIGAFGDYDFSSMKGTIQDQGPSLAGDIKQTSAWAVGGRAGWLVTPGVLSYGNGGYAQARFSGANMVNTIAGVPTAFSTPDTTFHGWFLGGGVEAAITPNLFWRNEYRFARYDNETLPDTSGAVALNSINFKPSVQTVTTQLVYKFSWLR